MTTALIIAVFVIGYVFITLESVTKLNKSAIALFMAVLCWSIYNIGFGITPEGTAGFSGSLAETCEIILFLMGAMTIVEVVDRNGGFNFVKERLKAKTKRGLLWKITIVTFFLSAVLDNMTTAIVMVMVLNKLISGTSDKLKMAAMVILAANAGGAFSPIGDVTTIMLWVKGNVSSLGIIKEAFLPSVVSVIVPALILHFTLNGEVSVPESDIQEENSESELSRGAKLSVLFIGVGGLLLVPVFRALTGLPPFMGIMLVLSILWIVTELIFHQKRYRKVDFATLPDVSKLLHKIDLSTILFFLGILTAVSALSQTGVLKSLGELLDRTFDGNPYLVTGIIGLLSAVIDNVPLVASCMGMYDIATPDTMAAVAGSAEAVSQLATYGMDGTFWSLLAYCAGVGGSILIIGSTAGVVVMGIEKISFGWYLKHISGLALIGYLAGILMFWLQNMFVFGTF